MLQRAAGILAFSHAGFIVVVRNRDPDIFFSRTEARPLRR